MLNSSVRMRPDLTMELSKASGPTAVILAHGDLCIPDSFGDGSLSRQTDRLFAPEILEFLADKDLSLIDLETPVIRSESPIQKSGPHLAGCPSTIQALVHGQFDVALLANNHILDYGPDAMFGTRDRCRQVGMQTVGIGVNLEDSYRPLVMTVNGLRVAIFNVAEEEFTCAGDTTPGAAKLDPLELEPLIRIAGKEADAVLVFPHGGNEFCPVPNPLIQRWYRFLVDCGADAVIGNHPHTIQGTEIYNGAPIVYSIGNFLFPWEASRPACWHEGMSVKLVVGRKSIHTIAFYAHMFHTQEGRLRVESLNGQDAESFRERLASLNELVADPSRLRDVWKCFCSDRQFDFLSSLKGSVAVTRSNVLNHVKLGLRELAAYRFGLVLTDLLARWSTRRTLKLKGRATICNLIRCPSHREAVQTMLELELGGSSLSESAWTTYRRLIRYCR